MTLRNRIAPFTAFAVLLSVGVKADELKRSSPTLQVTSLKDLTVKVEVTKLDSAELEKIGRDFSTIYRLKHLTLYYRSPDQLRLEGNSRVFGDGTMILNGTKRSYTVSKLHIKKSEDLKTSPAKRQSLMEFAGLIAEGTLDFLKPKFVKTEARLDVYELRYNSEEKSSYFVVSIEPKTHIVRSRRWFDADNHLRASFLYLGEKEVSPGIWLPERCEIRNAEGQLAAVMEYRDAKADTGLTDALFQTQ